MYLKKNKDSDYEILVLGKNGEPQKELEMNVAYKHRYIGS